MIKLSRVFLKPYQPQRFEEKIYRLWEKSGYFSPEKIKSKKKFLIFLPPPNVTGSLHLGHALNACISDILIRYKRMRGYKTLWLPGTDHAGIATQNVVEKELKKEGKTRFDLGKEKFLERVWEWKRKYGNLILKQLKRLGASCDWKKTRFTMDKDYTLAVKEAFAHLWNKGWVFLGKRIVNWCPRCQTSLSDLELEYQEEKSYLYYIKYPLAKSTPTAKSQMPNADYIVVATTRPETMLADLAVAVNPKDKRYQKIVGEKLILPLVKREIPIISDPRVSIEFGTGAVKITPAHDPLDYEIYLDHFKNLSQIPKIIDDQGRICAPAPEKYQGMKVEKAREEIIKDLEKENLIEKIEPYSHKVPICYRCHHKIEPLLKEQWFLKMEKLKKLAEKAVASGKIEFVPKRWEKVYFDWLKNVKDWCLSRQIWWGHQMPIWKCLSKNEYFLSLKKPRKCPICHQCQPKQIEDVFDTWFSSSLWPFATLNWPKTKKEINFWLPSDVLTTARDIINLWVARMIFMTLEICQKIPFKKVLIHPTILTKEGKRMSKSLGTGVDPMDLIKTYGADALRFALIWQYQENQDIRWSDEAVIAGKKFLNKIWNASRFVFSQLDQKISLKIRKKDLTGADQKILKELEESKKKIENLIEAYKLGKALKVFYQFFWHRFCDIYLEKFKKFDENQKKKSKIVLAYVLFESLKMAHPFLPFLTETIYQYFKSYLKKPRSKLLMIEKW
ncbi:valine--tRNA ligase [bacterium]|nr:valine--tRNA ligase [bacterium]